MPLPVFTIQTFNQNTLQPAGAVFAQRVDSVKTSESRGFLGSSGNSGDRRVSVEKKLNDLTASLMKELNIQTQKMYPTAVALVDVNINFSDICKDESSCLILGQASATALVKRTRSNAASPAQVTQPMVTQPMVTQPMVTQPMVSSAPVVTSAPVAPVINVSKPANVPKPANAPKPMDIPMPPVGGKRSKVKSRKNRK